MTKKELIGIWNYYLSIEQELSNTSRYIEPEGQEEVHSFEFAKLLILSCTEIESVFKMICLSIKGTQVKGDISAYKENILEKFPKITEAEVTINRLGRNIRPFEGWDLKRLAWWDAYQVVKHNRGEYFAKATYLNAVTAISALYILILYLAKLNELTVYNFESKYIDSEYGLSYLICKNNQELPDYQR